MIRKFFSSKTGNPRIRTLALAATIAATVYLMWQSSEPPAPDPEAAQLRGAAEPDGFVVGADYRAWNEQGQLEIHMTSPRIEQFDHDSSARMTDPRARLYGEGQAETEPWIIEADAGSLLQSQGLMHLEGNVIVLRTSGDSQATLATEALTLNNTEGTVSTDLPVTITEPFGTTQATGMKAWIDQRILELNSRVEGQYETVR